MPRKLFINLAVKSVKTSNEFFKQLGFTFNAQFSSDDNTCMIVNDEAFVMLLEHKRFSDFTKKPIVDSTKQVEVLVSFSADSREQVDTLANKALEIGGAPANPTQDLGFMYQRSFLDPDGHTWEVFWMDQAQVQQ